MTIYLGQPLPTASSVLPDRQTSSLIAVLFGLATGGVYIASLVTKTAVGSYPAFSTLPVFPEKPSAVYFLLHSPSAHAAWPLTSTHALCCPDFPPAFRCCEQTEKPAAMFPALTLNKLASLKIRSSELLFKIFKCKKI